MAGGGPLANGVRGGGGGNSGGGGVNPPLTPLRATNSGIPHYDIPGGAIAATCACTASDGSFSASSSTWSWVHAWWPACTRDVVQDIAEQ